jgi:methyl-accepting chemotaxis protein
VSSTQAMESGAKEILDASGELALRTDQQAANLEAATVALSEITEARKWTACCIGGSVQDSPDGY